ncbi:conserved protein [Tepidicaulis marinus]|uniref:Murein endopeptidase K n=1 Tax=Tepidicaulis marinus TaxID=1333998 RepID=A0A081B8Q8_9HYPH|nr:DUF882 domain-containing protein [Tepidicaulis marinus]GAK44426.1 conserved protein [Tepidicaulis marinus]
MKKQIRSKSGLSRRKALQWGTAAAASALVTPALVRAEAPYKRILKMQSLNSGEKLTITYWADGAYIEDALPRINWFMRDLRTHESFKMDVRLLDLLWEIDQNTRSNNPLYTMSGYRSPETNAMLAATSEGVDEASFHMRGMAMDLTQDFRDPEALFLVAKKLGRGGAGFYPTKRPFVHVDVGPKDLWRWPEKPREGRAVDVERGNAETAPKAKS